MTTTLTVNPQTILIIYGVLHVLYGLVTHYHSTREVRRHNPNNDKTRRVSTIKVFFCFLGRMSLGFECFLICKLIAPIGNRWHWTPQEIKENL